MDPTSPDWWPYDAQAAERKTIKLVPPESGQLQMLHGEGIAPSRVDAKPVVTGPPTELLGTLGLSLTDYYAVITCARLQLPLDGATEVRFRKAVGLAPQSFLPPEPDNWAGPVSDAPPDEQVPLPYDGDYTTAVDECLAGRLDWDVLFPFRTKGAKALLRARLPDLPALYADSGLSLRAALLELEHMREYVLVLNMCLANLVFSSRFPWLAWWRRRGALRSPAAFERYSKAVTIALKASVYGDAYGPLIEATGMTGFRLLPDPAFDPVKETGAAATGFGYVHETADGLARPFGWMDCVGVLSAIPSARAKSVSFDDFLRDAGAWATSGSSSYGKLFYRVDGEMHHTKARKLMLPYVTDPGVLRQLARRANVSTTVAVIKSELAKIRIAVAGDLGYYLIWAYLHFLSGDVYDQWPGVTLAESPEAELRRMAAMQKAVCAGGYGAPFDFKSFDKQPTDAELLAIAQMLAQPALMTRPETEPWIVQNALAGMINSTLATPPGVGQVQIVFAVRNQLPSGIAITSAVGNAFNCVASESTNRLVEAWTGMSRQLWLTDLALRGDDSSFVVVHVAFALLLALAGAALKYVYAPGKVAVIAGATELLRVHYSIHGARGYPARIIPSLSQRKPWSNEPWDAEGVIRAWWATCATLQRRRCRGMWLFERLRKRWGQLRRLPPESASTSPLNGGLGLGQPPNWLTFVTPALHTTPALEGVHIEPAPWSQQLVRDKFRRGGYALSAQETRQLTTAAAVATLSTVDAMTAASVAKDAYARGLLLTRVRITRPTTLSVGYQDYLSGLCDAIAGCRTLDPWNDLPMLVGSTSMGSEWRETGAVVLAKDMSRLRSQSIRQLLPPILWAKAQAKAQRFRVGLTVALDWLTGSPPAASYAWCHPNIASVAARLTCAAVENHVGMGDVARLGFGTVFSHTAWMIGHTLAEHPFLGPLYRW